MTDLTLTPEQRGEAIEALAGVFLAHGVAVDFDGEAYVERPNLVAERALDALLPLLSGWRPEPVALPDARAAAPLPEGLTTSQVHDACLSYRHDYGLLDEQEARIVRIECSDWFRAIRRALPSIPPQEPTDAEVEAAAVELMTLDQGEDLGVYRNLARAALLAGRKGRE